MRVGEETRLSAVTAGSQCRHSAVGAGGGQLAHLLGAAVPGGKYAGGGGETVLTGGDEARLVCHRQGLCQCALRLLAHGLEQAVYL